MSEETIMGEAIFEYLGLGALCIGVAAFWIAAAPVYVLLYLALKLRLVK